MRKDIKDAIEKDSEEVAIMRAQVDQEFGAGAFDQGIQGMLGTGVLATDEDTVELANTAEQGQPVEGSEPVDESGEVKNEEEGHEPEEVKEPVMTAEGAEEPPFSLDMPEWEKEAFGIKGETEVKAPQETAITEPSVEASRDVVEDPKVEIKDVAVEQGDTFENPSLNQKADTPEHEAQAEATPEIGIEAAVASTEESKKAEQGKELAQEAEQNIEADQLDQPEAAPEKVAGNLPEGSLYNPDKKEQEHNTDNLDELHIEAGHTEKPNSGDQPGNRREHVEGASNDPKKVTLKDRNGYREVATPTITTGEAFEKAVAEGKRYDYGTVAPGHEQKTVINKGQYTGEDYEREIKSPDGKVTNSKWDTTLDEEGIPRAQTEFMKSMEEGHGADFARTYHNYNGSDAIVQNPDRWMRATKESFLNVAFHGVMAHLQPHSHSDIGNTTSGYTKNKEGDYVLKEISQSKIAPGISTKFQSEKTKTGPDRGMVKISKSKTFGKASWGTSTTKKPDGTVIKTEWAGNVDPFTGKIKVTSSKTTITNKNQAKANKVGLMRAAFRMGAAMISNRKDLKGLVEHVGKYEQARDNAIAQGGEKGKAIAAERAVDAKELKAITDNAKMTKVSTKADFEKVNLDKVAVVLDGVKKEPISEAQIAEKLKGHMTTNETSKALESMVKDEKIKKIISYDKVQGVDGKEKQEKVVSYLPNKEYAQHASSVKGAIDSLADRGFDTFSRKVLDVGLKGDNGKEIRDGIVSSVLKDMSKTGEIKHVKNDKFARYEIAGAKEAKAIQREKAAEIMLTHDKSSMSVSELSKAFESQGMKVSEEKMRTLTKEMKAEGKVQQISDNTYALKERSQVAYNAAPFQERSHQQKANEATVKIYMAAIEDKKQGAVTKAEVTESLKSAKQNMDSKTVEKTMDGLTARQELHIAGKEGDVKTYSSREPKIEVSKAKVDKVLEAGKDAKTPREFVMGAVKDLGAAVHSTYSGLKEATEKKFGKNAFKVTVNELAKDEKITVKPAKDGVMIIEAGKEQSKGVMPVKEKVDVMGKGHKPGIEAEAKKFANAHKFKDLTAALIKADGDNGKQKTSEPQKEQGGKAVNFKEAKGNKKDNHLAGKRSFNTKGAGAGADTGKSKGQDKQQEQGKTHSLSMSR